jgi:hypothetical protein
VPNIVTLPAPAWWLRVATSAQVEGPPDGARVKFATINKTS